MVQVENDLKENYKNKIVLLKILLSLSKKQEERIEQDDMENLLKVLDEREQVMQEIDKLDAAQDQLMKLLGLKAAAGIDTRVLSGLKGLQDDIKDCLLSIEKLDKANQESAKNKLDEYKKQVLLSRQMQKGVNTYANPFSQEDGVYIDAKK